MRNSEVYRVAFGGVMAAVAVVVMCLDGMIPIATFVCPMACMLLLRMVLGVGGKRIAWAWYGAVTVLGSLLGPDREAAAIFAALGYYPILKPWLDRRKLAFFWKLLFFNVVTLALYWVLIHLFGMDAIAAEFEQLGKIMTAVTLLLGNVTFFLLDRVLGKKWK